MNKEIDQSLDFRPVLCKKHYIPYKVITIIVYTGIYRKIEITRRSLCTSFLFYALMDL